MVRRSFSLARRGKVLCGMLVCLALGRVAFGQPAEVERGGPDQKAPSGQFDPSSPDYRRGYSKLDETTPFLREFVTARIVTSNQTEFQVACEVGKMIYVTNEATEERYSFVLFPQERVVDPTVRTASGFERVGYFWRLVDAEFTVRALKLLPGQYGDDVIELGKGAINAIKKDELYFPESGVFLVPGDYLLQRYRSANGSANLGSECCVSCGGYSICGCSVTSSCGSCTGCSGGVRPLIKD